MWSGRINLKNLFVALTLLGLALFGIVPAGAAPAIAVKPAPAAGPADQGKILADITKALQQQIQELAEQLAQGQSELKKAQDEAQALGISISTHKTALSLDKISVEQAKELQQFYARLAEQKAKVRAALALELEKYAKIQAELTEATRKGPGAAPGPGKTQASRATVEQNQQYFKLAATAITKLEELQQVLQARLEVLAQEQRELEEFADTFQRYAEEKFKTQLLERQKPTDTLTLAKELFIESLSLPQRVYAWGAEKIRSGAAAKLLTTYRSQLLGLLFFLGLLLYAMKLLRRRTRDFRQSMMAGAATFSLRLMVAVVNVLASNYYLLAILIWLALSLQVMKVLDQPAAKLGLGGLAVAISIRLVKRLLQAVFAPAEPEQGIITVEHATARYYSRYGSLSFAFLVGGYYFLWGLTLSGPQDSGFHFAVLLYLITMIFWFAWLLRKPHLENLLAGAGLDPHSRLIGMIRGIRFLIMLGLSIVIIIDLLGYQNLALYLASSAFLTTLVVAGSWLADRMGQDLNQYLTSPQGFLANTLGLRPETLEGLQVVLIHIFRLVVLLTGAAVILLTWGVDAAALKKIAAALSQGPSLGPVTFSPLGIFLAVFSIWLARRISRFARQVLETRLFQQRGWDLGIRHTISNTLHYTLMILGIILALVFLGVNFANLAIIAGGLGVGIGFGLQNIVNNFLSGLILLFERPIKVGDLLVIDGQWGTVRDIRVRSTVFETAERSVLIIPNSDLLSNKILNWTFYGRGPARLTLKVGVAYDSDVHEVTKTIDRVCRKNPRVLSEPPPQIYFNAYGDSSLDFVIWVFIRTPQDRVPATHELNAAIFDAFKQQGIEFPYPQMDVHIRTAPLALQPQASPPGTEKGDL